VSPACWPVAWLVAHRVAQTTESADRYVIYTFAQPSRRRAAPWRAALPMITVGRREGAGSLDFVASVG
jgi:hypothetical protein